MSRDWTQEEFGITEDTPVSDVEQQIRFLQAKVDTAINALNTIFNACEIKVPHSGINPVRPEHMFIRSIQDKAKEALVVLLKAKSEE